MICAAALYLVIGLVLALIVFFASDWMAPGHDLLGAWHLAATALLWPIAVPIIVMQVTFVAIRGMCQSLARGAQ